jgi:DNA-binding transcriptional MocR family regulator
MQDELADYFNKVHKFSNRWTSPANTSQISLQPTHLDYGHGPYGSPALRTALSTFINNQFHPFKPVEPSHLVIAAGVTATLDLIAYSIADENDAILIGRPLYTSFRNDLGARAQVSLVPVCGGGVDPLSVEMVGRYEEEFLKQRERGVKVRGIVLCKYVTVFFSFIFLSI